MSVNIKSLEIILCVTKEYGGITADLMKEKAREYGLNPEIRELNNEEAKFHPALPYFATDYGNYQSFESLLDGFEEKGIILKKIKEIKEKKNE